MRILVLTTEAFGGYGGIALYNRELSKALCAYPGCREVIVVPRLMPYSSESLPDKLTYVTEGLNSKLRYIAAVSKIVYNNPRFDLIVCGHINLMPLAHLYRLWTQAPILLSIYGIDAWEPTQRWIANTLVDKVDKVVSISEFTKQRFLEWTKIKNTDIFLLPNPVDMAYYSPGPENRKLIERYGLTNKTVLVTVGRLVSKERHKGFDEVLEVIPELSKKIPHIVYLIVGGGDDRQRLEKKVQSLGIKDYVVFTGFIPEDEKVDHYRLADVYVMPSSREGFGFVFLEAMACGIPVVASKVDGSREAVREGELGILVNPSDPEEIKAGIFEALSRPKGLVPKGLEYFSYGNFEQRCHRIVDQVICIKNGQENKK
jgi:glycosyltransferase involved in cell wall biosynthesis